jgi:hypothetical protein
MLGFRVSAAVIEICTCHISLDNHSSDYLGRSSDIALEHLCAFQVLDSPKVLPRQP